MMDALIGLLLILGICFVVAQFLSSRVREAPQPHASPSRPATARNRSGSKSLYRTRDGQTDYSFSFEQLRDGTWRAYILDQPSYQGRADDAHASHRLSAGGRKYVCWTDPLRSLEQAKQIAALWADATQQYIRSGTRF